MENSKDGSKMESECNLSSELILQCKKENLHISQPSCESEDCAVVDLNGDCSMLMLKSEKDNIDFIVKTETNGECCENKDYFKTELGYDCGETDVQAFNIKHEEVHIKTEEVDNSRNQHDMSLRCKFCKNKFNTQCDIDKHMEHCNSPKLLIYSCKICNYTTEDKHDLETHMQTHLDLETLGIVYRCEFCQFKAITKSAIQHHWPLHQCMMCGVMQKEQDLQSHMELHKDMPQTNRFQCDMCNFKAIGRTDLSVHMARMHQCPIWKYSAKKGYHKNYMIVHKGRPQNRCEHCTFKSKYCATLRTHLSSIHNIKK